MPQFRYEATDTQGRPVTGDLNAADANFAIKQLGDQGLRVRSIVEAKPAMVQPSASRSPVQIAQPPASRPVATVRPQPAPAPQPVSVHSALPPIVRTRRANDRQRWFVFTQLATLIRSGIAPHQALTSMHVRIRQKHIREALLSMANDVRDGRPMSDAMRRYPDIFAPGDVGMVRVGELSGALPQALAEIAEQRKDARSLGMAFWIFWIVLINALLSIPLGLSLLHTMRRMFDAIDYGADTDFFAVMQAEMTRQLTTGIGMWGFVAGIVLLIAFLIWNRTEFRLQRHTAVLGLPYHRKRAIAESMEVFSRSLEMLSRAGFPSRSAWIEAAISVPNLKISNDLSQTGMRLGERTPLSQVLYQMPGVDEEVAPIVENGELTGDVPGALRQVAASYGDRKQSSGRFAKIAAWVWAICLGIVTGAGLFFLILRGFYSYAIDKTMTGE
ncbi:MAG: Type II secretion system protein F [Fimbriimonadaceae bacterium]|nr:Type II secretion system protein F [Fimbriimonadaceae bacterium]